MDGKFIIARKMGGTCVLTSKSYFKAGMKYLISVPDPTVLKIQRATKTSIANVTFLKPKLSTARKDGRTVTLSVGKFLNPSDVVELTSFTENEIIFSILSRRDDLCVLPRKFQ